MHISLFYGSLLCKLVSFVSVFDANIEGMIDCASSLSCSFRAYRSLLWVSFVYIGLFRKCL